MSRNNGNTSTKSKRIQRPKHVVIRKEIGVAPSAAIRKALSTARPIG